MEAKKFFLKLKEEPWIGTSVLPFGNSGQGAWFPDSSEKLGKVGVFTLVLSKDIQKHVSFCEMIWLWK